MADAVAYADGRVMPLEDATVPITDRGFLLGDGVFETLRTVGRAPLRWDLHERRMVHGLSVIGIDTQAAAEAKEAVGLLVDAADGRGELYVRVQVARDPSVREPEDAAGVVTAVARPLVPYPHRVYAQGVSLQTAGWRKDARDPLATVKHLSYLPYLMARRQARQSGADDALILNTAGRVCEASHSNVIVVVDGALHAPGAGEGALEGVTRHVLLESDAIGRTPVVDRVPAQALARAEEVVLTNTVGGVVPVRLVDGASRPAGPEGPWYQRLRDAHTALVTA